MWISGNQFSKINKIGFSKLNRARHDLLKLNLVKIDVRGKLTYTKYDNSKREKILKIVNRSNRIINTGSKVKKRNYDCSFYQKCLYDAARKNFNVACCECQKYKPDLDYLNNLPF